MHLKASVNTFGFPLPKLTFLNFKQWMDCDVSTRFIFSMNQGFKVIFIKPIGIASVNVDIFPTWSFDHRSSNSLQIARLEVTHTVNFSSCGKIFSSHMDLSPNHILLETSI
jgi:hypothetical protein